MAHIAIVPSPGMGHLIPLAEFAKRLVRLHEFKVTFIIPLDGPPTKALKSTLDNLPTGINSVFLPEVDLSDVGENPKIETVISVTVARSLSSLRQVLRTLVDDGNSLTALVVDLFGTDTFEVAREFNISPFIFFPSTAMCMSLFLYLPKLDEMVTNCEYRDWTELINIPGCVPVPGSVLLDPLQDRSNDAYKWTLHHAKRYVLADGLIENSFSALEPGAIKALTTVEPGKPPVYPVGPLVNMDNPVVKVDGSHSLEWLDDQPHGSVLFVSFGSGGTLSSAQLTELALGLELSEQRFLWVVRSPNDEISNATFFNAQSKDVKVGIPINANYKQNDLIERHQVAIVVKALMEGESGKRVRYNMKELKESATKVLLSPDGSSAKALAELAHKWKNPKINR
ncbi:hypothetical protein ACFE04_026235 [Oxalis oulophora]